MRITVQDLTKPPTLQPIQPTSHPSKQKQPQNGLWSSRRPKTASYLRCALQSVCPPDEGEREVRPKRPDGPNETTKKTARNKKLQVLKNPVRNQKQNIQDKTQRNCRKRRKTPFTNSPFSNKNITNSEKQSQAERQKVTHQKKNETSQRPPPYWWMPCWDHYELSRSPTWRLEESWALSESSAVCNPWGFGTVSANRVPWGFGRSLLVGWGVLVACCGGFRVILSCSSIGCAFTRFFGWFQSFRVVLISTKLVVLLQLYLISDWCSFVFHITSIEFNAFLWSWLQFCPGSCSDGWLFPQGFAWQLPPIHP